MKKPNKMSRSSRSLAAMLVLASTLQYCAEPKTGCLDVRATNFEVDADAGCEDCCTYPQLRIDLLHKFTIGDSLLNFVPGSTYPDGAGAPFRLSDLRFYFSEIHLLRTNGTTLQLEDQIVLRKANANGDSIKIEVEDNFGLATPASLARILPGNFRDGGTFTGIRFNIGIGEPARNADPNSAPASHPLRPQSIPMWTSSQGYLSQRIEVFSGSPPADTIRRILEYGGAASVKQISLSFNQPLAVPPGFHIALTLRIDYARWLKNIQFRTDSDAAVFRKISENLPFSFLVTGISATSN